MLWCKPNYLSSSLSKFCVFANNELCVKNVCKQDEKYSFHEKVRIGQILKLRLKKGIPGSFCRGQFHFESDFDQWAGLIGKLAINYTFNELLQHEIYRKI